MHSESVEIYVYIKFPDFRCIDQMSLISEQFHHNHIHTLPINELVILIINVFDELHNIDRVSIRRDPSLELWVFILHSFDQVEKHDIKTLLQQSKFFLFFTWVVIDYLLNVIPNDALAFLVEGAALVEMFGACFTHESGHCTLRVNANWITCVTVNTFRGFFHSLILVIWNLLFSL